MCQRAFAIKSVFIDLQTAYRHTYIYRMSQNDMYVKSFTLQLDELEFLSAAFPATEEFRNLDESLAEEMRVFIEEVQQMQREPPERLLQITLAPASTHAKAHKYEVSFELPHLYPVLENANVRLHSPVLNQAKEVIFKAQLQQYMSTLDREEPHVYLLLSWIQEFVDELLARDAVEIETETAQLQQLTASNCFNFERLWIYSHHIKSSTKRQLIVQTAQQLQLSGFSLVGKPGIICVEGVQEHTQQFWREIKALNWQKISLRKEEPKLQQSKQNELHLRRFNGFTEFMLTATEDAQNRAACMNMREFLEYLNAHKSAYMKHELFGIN